MDQTKASFSRKNLQPKTMTALALQQNQKIYHRGMQLLSESSMVWNLGDLVFVYGTLMFGNCNHAYLEKAKRLGNAVTRHRYPMVVNGKCPPIVLPMEGYGLRIHGELYQPQTPDEWLKLDRLEGHPEIYRRGMIEVGCEGKRYVAWCYFYRHAFATELDPSKWVDEYLED